MIETPVRAALVPTSADKKPEAAGAAGAAAVAVPADEQVGTADTAGDCEKTQVLDPFGPKRGSQDCGSNIFHKPFLPCCCGW